jgi:fructose-bisphosphate aldolase class 1
LPNLCKKSSIVPIVEPGKEDNRDTSKYRPISLLNVAGKVLDRLMTDRIMHHVHTNAGLNRKQYGFILQRGTVDAGMAVKEIAEKNLEQKNSTSVVSLGVRGTFDTACWPSILRNLKELKCLRNLFTCPELF